MLRDLIVGPHQISFDITNKCNLRCLHCYNSSGENLASQNELTDQEVLDFIDEFKSIKLLNFCFCGGEPLLRKELIVEAAKRLRTYGCENVAMVSNGILMTDEVIEELINAGVTRIQISLDGIKAESHDRIRNKKGVYEKALRWVLNHKRITLGSTIALFIVALGCFFTLGRSFLPPFNEGSFTINISSLPGISLEESNKMGHRAEMLLLTIPEIQTVARKTGRAELDEHALGVNTSEIEAPFELKDRSRSELIADVREKLGTITGANIEIGQPISHRIDAMLSGTKANIAIKLFGDDLNKMFSLGNEIKGAIEGIPGIADLNVEQQIERPQLKITPKREMLAKYGITLPEFSEYINVALAGEVISQVYEKGKAFDLIVKVKDNFRDEAEKIRNLMVDTSDGKKVPLSYVADVVSAMGPNTINRENVKRKIVISANVADRDLRSVVNDIQKKIDTSVKLPEGYHIEYGGQFESEQAASRTLALTSFMSIVIIFLLLYHEFRSVKESGVILLNLPLALIGGVFALLITTGEVSIPAIIGFISLFGIATRNGMLLISHYNHLQQEEGMGVYDSVIHGSLDRLNPILMTALSSALALIPLALSGDLPGNEIQSPMAKVILGGLLTSTFLNGFIIPIVYLMMHRRSPQKKEIRQTTDGGNISNEKNK